MQQSISARGGAASERTPDTASVLLVDGCNYVDFPVGGALTNLRQIVRVCGPKVALVGAAPNPEVPIGQWTRQNIEGHTVDYFAFWRPRVTTSRPWVPYRLQVYRKLARYRRQIMASGVRSAYITNPEVLLATRRFGFDHVVVCLPGLSNPVGISRYGPLRRLAPAFDMVVSRALRRASVILATGDAAAISRFRDEHRTQPWVGKLRPAWTYYDSAIFRPLAGDVCRKRLGISQSDIVFVTTGRINGLKGWRLLISAFGVFHSRHVSSRLFFVGDGEERAALESAIRERGLGDAVTVTGMVRPDTVAMYLNSSDAAISGSYTEGWPTALVEAIACGKPVVSTSVSGIQEIVSEGKNGMILRGRDPVRFADAMEAVLRMRDSASVSLATAQRFSLEELEKELSRVFPQLRAPGGQGAER